ncbi:MAG: S24 family peptidase [bacterium]
MKISEIIKICSPINSNPIKYSGKLVSAGRAVKINDGNEEKVDLNSLLIQHPAATFFARVTGESQFAGIVSGDMVVVDTVVEPTDGSIVCVASNEDIFLKKYIFVDGKEFLESADSEIEAIDPDQLLKNKILGTVTKIIHSY